MGLAGEFKDFSSSYETAKKRLDKEAVRAKKPSEKPATTSHDASGSEPFPPPLRLDYGDKGYMYREGGIVKPVERHRSMAKAKRV